MVTINGTDYLERAKVRFLAKVQMPSTTNDCWIWIGGKNPTMGHGVVGWKGTSIGAHRLSWMIYRGEINDGLFVLHKCDNPPCVNSEHLFLGTQADNVADMNAKGRNGLVGNVDWENLEAQKKLAEENKCTVVTPRGDGHYKTKLTADNVRAMRTSYKAGISGAVLAEQYGIKKSTVYAIVHYQNWKHVE